METMDTVAAVVKQGAGAVTILMFAPRSPCRSRSTAPCSVGFRKPTMLTGRARFWTRDKRLRGAAERLGVAAGLS